MANSPQPASYTPEKIILGLAEPFYDPVAPADFPDAILRFRNDRWARTVGLDELSDAEWIAHFGRFRPLEGSLPQPLALRYHGHQFRVYNPDIGDGRGFLFAQLRDGQDRILDLGTKGSGQTPYSRFGDGRLTLKGGVREILATEMLEALGVETSRTFSLIETGEALERQDEPSPTRACVLVRLSHSHIRIGTFQRLAHHRDTDAMTRLTDYVLRHYYGQAPGEDAAGNAVRLLDEAVTRTARLAASYMAAGFVHGVLNTDNINLTGESFDYGPWRFTPEWRPEFTAAYFDHAGLYAFGRQPEAIHWDVMQLAICLRQIVGEPEPLIAALEQFGLRYQQFVTAALLWRMGVIPRGGTEDQALIDSVEGVLRSTGFSVDRFFFDVFGGTLPDSYPAEFEPVRQALAGYRPRKARDHRYWSGQPCSMLIDEVEAIWKPIAAADDWSVLHRKIESVREMAVALA